MNTQRLFAQRIGGESFGMSTEIYKFEKIKRAKQAAREAYPNIDLLDFGVGEPDQIAPAAIRKALKTAIDDPANRGYADNGIAEFKKATQDFKESLDVEDDLKEARDTMREIKGDLQQTIQKSVAQGAAFVDNDNESDEDDDAMPAKDLEPPSEKAVEETPEEPVEDQSAPQAEKKAEEKEPSKDA